MSHAETWFGRRPSRPARTRSSRPALEALEERWMPSVTNHGGLVLQNVEVQNLFYGSTWAGDSGQLAQAGQLVNYTNYLVNSPYVDMLAKAGYGVGRGSVTGGNFVDRSAATQGNIVLDSEIRGYLQNSITAGTLDGPDANRLYVLYIEPNVEVVNDSYYDSTNQRNDNSVLDFAGYHDSFTGTDANGNPANIRYAVVTTPGGTIGNAYTAGETSLSTFDEMTQTASHEIAEATTDPDPNIQKAWYDDNFVNPTGSKGAEIGDIVNGQGVRLNGYLVQAVSDQNDNAIVPATLSFQGQNVTTRVNTFFTANVAIGSDPTGLTNAANLTVFIGWGDGNYSYGYVTQDPQGNFDAVGWHLYTQTGTYQATVEVYDNTNSISTAFAFDTITVNYQINRIRHFNYLGATANAANLPAGGAQQSLALTQIASPTTAASTTFASTGSDITPTTPSAALSTSLSTAPNSAMQSASQTTQQSDAPAVANTALSPGATQLADLAFSSMNFNPLLMGMSV
jgi:hypothetical protein